MLRLLAVLINEGEEASVDDDTIKADLLSVAPSQLLAMREQTLEILTAAYAVDMQERLARAWDAGREAGRVEAEDIETGLKSLAYRTPNPYREDS